MTVLLEDAQSKWATLKGLLRDLGDPNHRQALPLANLSATYNNLNKVLQDQTRFVWDPEQQPRFDQVRHFPFVYITLPGSIESNWSDY